MVKIPKTADLFESIGDVIETEAEADKGIEITRMEMTLLDNLKRIARALLPRKPGYNDDGSGRLLVLGVLPTFDKDYHALSRSGDCLKGQAGT